MRQVKCVIWDLDNTLWKGVLLESDKVYLYEEMAQLIRMLDGRGIVHSISSKNDYGAAMCQLEAFSLWEYFLYPQINWNPKSGSIQEISAQLNLTPDSFVFVDDQEYERREVAYVLPQIWCVSPDELPRLAQTPPFFPIYQTEDTANRRKLYQAESRRRHAEKEFGGYPDEFLRSLHMAMDIFPAQEEDLMRAEELTVRTHQMNTTGYSYSHEELNAFHADPRYTLLMCSLRDDFGTYGKVGISLIEHAGDIWIIKLFLMSCRVMTRGAGTKFLQEIVSKAQMEGMRLQAEFIPNGKNRMMEITYRLGGFRESGKGEKKGVKLLEYDFQHIPAITDYIQVTSMWEDKDEQGLLDHGACGGG